MRLTKEIVAKREQFVKDLFKADPKLSAAKANEQLKAKEGSAMRVTRIYELKKIALTEAQAPATPAQAQETAKAERPGKKVNGNGKLVGVTMVLGDPKVLKDALQSLKDAGVSTGITVEHTGADYSIVRKVR